jgi:hypothetical protein
MEESELRKYLLDSDIDIEKISWSDVCGTINNPETISKQHRENIYLLILEHYVISNVENGRSLEEIKYEILKSQNSNRKKSVLPYNGSVHNTSSKKMNPQYKISDFPTQLQQLIKKYILLFS